MRLGWKWPRSPPRAAEGPCDSSVAREMKTSPRSSRAIAASAAASLSSRMWRARISRRSEEHTSELQSLMRISYAVFCLKKKTDETVYQHTTFHQETIEHRQIT